MTRMLSYLPPLARDLLGATEDLNTPVGHVHEVAADRHPATVGLCWTSLQG